jgi:glycosyltransferase involved in cell wall biosynthesis
VDPRRFEVEVWCLARGGAVADRLRHSGTPVRILNLTTYHRPLNIVRLAWRLRQSRADIVHTHGYFASTFGRLAAIPAQVRKVVTHVHTSDFNLSRRHFRIEKCLACLTREIICVSQSVQNFVADVEGIRRHKTRVIYNGAMRPSRENSPPMSRTCFGLVEADCVLVSIGSLVENKGHRVLIDAFRVAAALHPGLKLLIVGEGPLRHELERYVRRSRLAADIQFLGIRKDICDVLALADIFILPSRYREGLPLAILEAMQQGLPVISTCIGGIPEAVEHNCSGLLVPAGDAVALKDAIAKLAADGNLRRIMGNAGRKRYEERFKAETMVSQIESLYTSICRGGERIAA